MIRIKEAYRLLRRNKRKSIITITKIFIPAEIANSIVKRMYFLFFILEFTYYVLLHWLFVRAICDVSCLVSRLFLSFVERALYAYFFIIIYFFVREEKRDEVDFELSISSMILLKLQALVDFLLSDLDNAWIRIRCRADCKIYPNRMISLFDICHSMQYFKILGQRWYKDFFIYTSNRRSKTYSTNVRDLLGLFSLNFSSLYSRTSVRRVCIAIGSVLYINETSKLDSPRLNTIEQWYHGSRGHLSLNENIQCRYFFIEKIKKKREVGREEEMKKIYTYILPERVLVRDLIEEPRFARKYGEICLRVEQKYS